LLQDVARLSDCGGIVSMLIGWANEVFTAIHAWVFMTLVEPVLFYFDGAGVMEQAYDGTELFLLGLLQIAVLYAILRPLESWRPAEQWGDRRDVGVDVIYTFLHRLGLFSIVLFFVLDPLVDQLAGALRLEGLANFNLDDLWPGVTSIPLVAFCLYLVVLDFVNYWIHRGQHRFRWWWALHSLHHSQRQMSLWTDDRNHLLDDLIRDAIFALIAVVIGVQPGQFVLLLIATRSLESLQHANLRLSFGRWGERMLVSPRFHRRHHAIGDGHEGIYRGCNFAVLFPIWDVCFGSANFEEGYPATGIRDQLAQGRMPGREYGRGFWSQQWLGLKRMVGG
jgi:sterol desaturase/sphingolipid hydroxylase (fatty acid hydroxylase superfamily)